MKIFTIIVLTCIFLNLNAFSQKIYSETLFHSLHENVNKDELNININEYNGIISYLKNKYPNACDLNILKSQIKNDTIIQSLRKEIRDIMIWEYHVYMNILSIDLNSYEYEIESMNLSNLLQTNLRINIKIRDKNIMNSKFSTYGFIYVALKNKQTEISNIKPPEK